MLLRHGFVLRRCAHNKMYASSLAVPAYPAVRADLSVRDVLHGTTVADPYRWLEDPDSAETGAFVRAQNEVTRGYIASNFLAMRDGFRRRLEQLQDYERVGCPFRRGTHVYAHRNTGLQNQDVLYRLADGAAASPTAPAGLFDAAVPFLDLNARFPDGTTALGSSAFSEDGTLFAYGLSSGGSDWQTLRVKDCATLTDLPDEIPWVKFSRLAWTHDGAGFFYNRHPAPAVASGSEAGTETNATNYCMLCYHRVGTPTSADLLVYANPAQPTWLYSAEVTDDGEYLLVLTHKGTDPVNRVYVAHLPTIWAAWAAAAAATPCAVPPGGAPPAQGAYAYLPLARLVDNWEAEYDCVANVGRRFFFKTNLRAPRYRVVCLDLPPTPAAAAGGVLGVDQAHGVLGEDADGPTPEVWDAVPEHAADVLDWAACVAGDKVVLCYMRDVANVLQLRQLPAAGVLPALTAATAVGAAASTELAGPVPIPLPCPGTVASFAGRRDSDAVFVKHVSFLSPGTILKVQFAGPGASTAAPDAAATTSSSAFSAVVASPLASGATTATAAAAVVTSYFETAVPGFDASQFVAEQTFVESGGARIPLFVVRKKAAAGAAPAPAPTLLYGYGGFNISLQPNFSAMRLLWLSECGGVYALACIRGGGEYGEAWHQAGSKLAKQRCFDDFAACARHLVDTGVAARRRVGIMGGSNGGLLVLASALQHPELFGAGVAQVPVADMLRFHKFTVGALWRGEYGFSEDSEQDFRSMLAYSPLHCVRGPGSLAAELPSLLITTADHDDRVVPLHSFKMVATLQAVAGPSPFQTRPLLIRIDEKAGHGAGKPTGKVLDEYADVYAFLQHELSR